MNNGNPKIQIPKSEDFPEEYRDGYVIFMGERFKVDPRALIPRIETEELVKYALRILQKYPEIQVVADIGTGCGIIPISIATKAGRELQIFATDMSKEALELAKSNDEGRMTNDENKKSLSTKSQTNQSAINFLCGSLLQPIITYFGNSSPDAILITANLPYVREKEINSGLIHEPRMAFLGGEITGFELYEDFFRELIAWKHRPKICHVIIEFGLWQRDIAETLFQKLDLHYTFFEDLRGIERFAYIISKLSVSR